MADEAEGPRCPDCGSFRFHVYAQLDVLVLVDTGTGDERYRVEAVELRSYVQPPLDVGQPLSRDEHGVYDGDRVVCADCGRPLLRSRGPSDEYEADCEAGLHLVADALEVEVEHITLPELPPTSAWTWDCGPAS